MAVGIGLVLGVLGRDLPEALAVAILPSAEVAPCGMEEVLSCAFENLPSALDKVIELALVVLLLCAVLAALGAVSIGVGGYRLWRTARRHRIHPADPPTQERPDWLGLSFVGLGTSFLVPGAWLLGSFLVFLAR